MSASRPLTFDCLPVEVHTIIFGLAWSADFNAEGHTYRTALSLCLVSRTFYSLAVPVLYRTLLIAGRENVLLLARTLCVRPDLGECAIHLFLSDRGRQQENVDDDSALEVLPSFAFSYPRTREGRVERLQRMHVWLAARSETLAAFRTAVHDILDVVSLRLHTLAICLYRHYNSSADSGLSDALEHPYPALTELTVRENSQPQPCERLSLPALVRLHIAAGNPPHPFSTLGTLIDSCPRLTHVRLSEPLINEVAVSALETALTPGVLAGGQPQSDAGSDLGSPASTSTRVRGPPRTLERFVLEPSPFMVVNSPTGGGADAFAKLERLAERTSFFELVTCTALSGGKREDRYPFSDALRDWTDRVMGRIGCWKKITADK